MNNTQNNTFSSSHSCCWHPKKSWKRKKKKNHAQNILRAINQKHKSNETKNWIWLGGEDWCTQQCVFMKGAELSSPPPPPPPTFFFFFFWSFIPDLFWLKTSWSKYHSATINHLLVSSTLQSITCLFFFTLWSITGLFFFYTLIYYWLVFLHFDLLLACVFYTLIYYWLVFFTLWSITGLFFYTSIYYLLVLFFYTLIYYWLVFLHNNLNLESKLIYKILVARKKVLKFWKLPNSPKG